jgi:hypothetical protein
LLERISEVFAHLNRVRAIWQARRKALLSGEGQAEFAAQFKLFTQTVATALSVSDTPEKCDEQLSRVILQLEEIEGRFSDLDELTATLAAKREEVVDAFSARKQALVDERQRRIQNLLTAADRIFAGVKRRAQSFGEDQLNAFFATDAMVHKLRQLSEQVAGLGERVKAEEMESRLKATRQEALRALRDRQELFREGPNIITLGRHQFAINTQPLDLTVVPRHGGMAFHLTGTDYYQPIAEPAFDETRAYWSQELASETDAVYRGEYLAATILFAAESPSPDASAPETRPLALTELFAASATGGLGEIVRNTAQARYDEGYERGIHDQDATSILARVLELYQQAGLLRFAPSARAWACLFWGLLADDNRRRIWQRRAQSLGRLPRRCRIAPLWTPCHELAKR